MAPDTQTLVLQAMATPEVVLVAVRAHVEHDGVTTAVELTDDGTSFGDARNDGVWVAQLTGPYAAQANVELEADTAAGQRVKLFHGVVTLDGVDRATVAWRLAEDGGSIVAWRTATDWPTAMPVLAEGNSVFIGLGWLLLLLVYVGVLLETRRPRAGRAE